MPPEPTNESYTPRVGYVYDARLKFHKELSEDTSLESVDIKGVMLKKRLQDEANKYKSYQNQGQSQKQGYNKYNNRENQSTSSRNDNGRYNSYNRGGGQYKNDDNWGRKSWGNNSRDFNDRDYDHSRRDYSGGRSQNSDGWAIKQASSDGRIVDSLVGASHADEKSYNPDDPRRTFAIYSILEASGCLDKMIRIKSKEATFEQITAVHDEPHYQALNGISLMEESKLREAEEKYDSVFFNRETAYCAKLCAGSVVELCLAIGRGELDSGFAITRPPGHHALKDKPKGFCVYNNIAIAIKELRRLKLANRIMVLDWDIHHGNGIQKEFYEDKDVFYFSIHRYENANFYPCSEEASAEYVGGERAAGRNVNVPWQSTGMNDGDYLYVIEKLLLPMAREFNPEFIIIACGFDAAEGDQMGLCHVSPKCYSVMTYVLLTLANSGAGGKLALVLEGGYNLEATANSALACVKSMLWIPFEDGLMPVKSLPVVVKANEPNYTNKSDLKLEPVSAKNSSQEIKKITDSARFIPKVSNFLPSSSCVYIVSQVLKIHKPYWDFLSK